MTQNITKNHNFFAYLAGWLSIIVNTLLFVLKFWVGVTTGSIAIIADAWHTLSDSISSVILIIGVKIATKPADKKHPFGHGRVELIVALLIGVLLAIIAFSFLKESILRLKSQTIVEYGTVAIVVMVVSILMKELLARYALWASRKSNRNMLVADAWHHRSDAFSSIIILIGIFLNKSYVWIDSVLGIMVAGFIFYTAYDILKDSINPLIGSKPDDTLLSQIRNICEQIGGEALTAHHFHLHDYLNHAELTFHINLPEKMTLNQAHCIATQIESRIREELNIEATIHMEPG